MAKKVPTHKKWSVPDDELREIASKPLPVSFDALVGGLLQVDPKQMPPLKKNAAKKKPS